MAFFYLCKITKIQHILFQQDAEKLAHAFVTSRLDFCNSLFTGSPNMILMTFKSIQNAAARALTRTNIGDHISPILDSLHWLSVNSRIGFQNHCPQLQIYSWTSTILS